MTLASAANAARSNLSVNRGTGPVAGSPHPSLDVLPRIRLYLEYLLGGRQLYTKDK
jgi:hypothetical protein